MCKCEGDNDIYTFVKFLTKFLTNLQILQTMGDEDNEVGLPQKGLNMIIKDVIPEMRVANESRELLNACCVEFVRHVSREAQRISADDQRKTIYHEHVQKGW